MKFNRLIPYTLLPLLTLVFISSCGNSKTGTLEATNGSGIEHLNSTTFKAQVFDYSNSTEWKYKGTQPCIIDFYATWCGPCKRIAPVLDELSKQYTGKIRFYKVNIDAEKDLAAAFGVESIPTIYFCPLNGKPQIEYGALPKENIVQIINTLFINKSI